jgi:tRNA (guanine-N7-)-methyltransferase
LEIFKKLLKPNGAICQKTDNMHFFEYSIEQFSACGFKLSNVSLDLHHSDFEGNIVTEYEEKFSSQGYPIYRLEARI